MIKLNAGFSRKVGEPNYGSRGASVNVELELESNLIGDPDALVTRIQELFTLAKRSVDAELAGNQTQAQSKNPPHNNRFSNNAGKGNGNGNRNNNIRKATASQVRAIHGICNSQGIDAIQLASEQFNVNSLEQLTIRQASSLIDELKTASNNGRNGGSQ